MVSIAILVGAVAASAIILGLVGYYVGAMNKPESIEKVDPVLGFVGLTSETPAPVEHDHEVFLVIKPREGNPIPEFYYEPTGLFIQPGDTVKFVFATPDHTVTGYHGAHGFTPRVPDNVGPFSSPLIPPGGYWLYTFEEEGVYDIFCGPHQAFGMAMRIVVGSATGPGTSSIPMGPPPEEPPFPPILTAGLVLSDPALESENIISKGKVMWGEVSPESKKLFIEFAG